MNLAYDDGEKESKVHTSLLRRPGLGAGPPSDEETDSEPEGFVQGWRREFSSPSARIREGPKGTQRDCLAA